MSSTRSHSHRAVALLVALAQLLLGCPPANPPLSPAVGLVERREPNFVAVPGGVVDVAGGNFLVSREDLVLDTRLGRDVFGAIYSGGAAAWRFHFESSYDGATFVDETGASFAVGALAPGAAIPGTHWVKLDASRIKTKGGLVHEYDASGQLAARYWASDPYPRIRYLRQVVAGAPRVSAIEQCTSASACTPLHALAWDAAGRLVSVEDRAGRRAEYAWDASGRLAVARDGLDVEKGWPGFRYTYAGPLLASVTNSEGERVDFTWSGWRLATAQPAAGSSPWRFEYQGRDPAGLYHTRFWSPTGEERRYAYDAEGRLLEELVVATGEVTTHAWSGQRPLARTLPNGATTTWTWADDDVQVRTDPGGNVVTFTYQPDGVDRENPRMRPVATITDSLGPVESRGYDGAGRLLAVANGEGEASQLLWGPGGTLASLTVNGVTRSFAQYGEHGHAAQVTLAGVSETRVFDAVGNLLRGSDGVTPLSGGIGVRGFDADRNLASLVLHASDGTAQTLSLEQRSDGKLLRVLRGGDDHEFVYDGFGRLVERRERADGAWQTTRFGYDAAGRPLFTERPNGMREEITWGPADRIATLQRLRDGVLENALTFSYQAGDLAAVEDSETGVESYVYDAAGRRVSTTFADGQRIDVAWDLRSRMLAEGFVTAEGAPLAALFYAWDLADRRVGLADAGGTLVATTWSDGRPSEIHYGNGLVRSLAYGPEGGLTSATLLDATGATLESTTVTSTLYEHESGALGVRQRASTESHGGVEVTTVEEYDLAPFAGGSDPAALAGARVVGFGDGSGALEGYVFDAKSNLLAQGARSFAYNAEGNRLLAVFEGGAQVGSYSYDAAGFASSRNGVPLAWDAAGRLVAHGADTLAWDGLGRLREARVGGQAARFLFGGRVEADAAGTPLAVELGEVKVGLGGAQRYRHFDFRGNVKLVSDETGQIVAHHRYAPFGLDAVFGSDDDALRFVGRSEIGELMLLGARVYDPSVGRFLSPDPLFQIVNAFAYTLGNPVWFSDADGMYAEANSSALGAISFGLAVLSATLSFGAALAALSGIPTLASILALGAALLAILRLLLIFGMGNRNGALRGPSPSAPGGSGGGGAATGGGGVGGPGGGGGAGCSPAALSALPDVDGWLGVLLPLQLLLGFLLLRRRRREQEAA
jgi:RHS repeat-associated protein